MNLKVRLRNPIFWIQLLLGIFATALAYAGLTASDMTTWGAVWEVLKGAFTNPYCLFLMASNIWAALNDPTTAGITDSARAKNYKKPS